MSNLPRHQYIGSYDAGCILGMNPYRPRLSVWEDKVNPVVRDLDNNHIRRGNTMEPIIEAYMKGIDPTINTPEIFARYDAEGKSGEADSISGTDNQIFMKHPRLSFVGGHPDGIGEDCYYEFKAPTQRKCEWIEESLPVEALRIGAEVSFDSLLKTGVPAYWLIQVQHGLMCTGLPKGELVIWNYDRWEPLRIAVTPDPALHELMEMEYEIFWTCVEAKMQPSGDDPVEIQQLTVVDEPELDAILAQYKSGYEQRYAGKDKQEDAKAKLLSLAGGRECVITRNHIASIKWVNRGSWGYHKITIKDRYEE